VVSESGHFERQFGNEAARCFFFKKMSTPWSDGQGGVGSRFSLRADFCDEVRRSPAEDADRPMYWRPPWLGGAQLENRALPTSTFLVSVRSGLYVRTEPDVHVPQPLALDMDGVAPTGSPRVCRVSATPARNSHRHILLEVVEEVRGAHEAEGRKKVEVGREPTRHTACNLRTQVPSKPSSSELRLRRLCPYTP